MKHFGPTYIGLTDICLLIKEGGVHTLSYDSFHNDFILLHNITPWSASGCDCDDNSPNPDELCPLDQKCKQCKCIPEGESGILRKKIFSCFLFLECDCDENSPNPDEFCPANFKCKQCKCLQEGKFDFHFLILLYYNYFIWTHCQHLTLFNFVRKLLVNSFLQSVSSIHILGLTCLLCIWFLSCPVWVAL